MAPKKELSLLPDEANSGSTSARVIRWISTVGRYVIVFTELIVILALLSRFWLDRQNADLSETIRQQEAILNSTREFETQYNLLQNRLKYIKTHLNTSPDYVGQVNSLTTSTPSKVVYESLTLQQTEDKRTTADLSLIAYEEEDLVNFITNLILNPDIQSVDIRSIEKKEKETRYSVNLQLLFKNITSNDRT